MSRKVGDISVKTGTYEKNGQTKGKWKTIGALMENDEGQYFLMLDATVISMQLFALANKDRDSHITCSVFTDNRQ
jgi:hypothetical protein